MNYNHNHNCDHNFKTAPMVNTIIFVFLIFPHSCR